jgi:hypothetical protein
VTRIQQTPQDTVVVKHVTIHQQNRLTATKLVARFPQRDTVALKKIFVVNRFHELSRTERCDFLINLGLLITNTQ